MLMVVSVLHLHCIVGQSPLSDVEIANPGLISVYLKLQHHEFRGDTIQIIEAILKDKNEFQLSLLKGGLAINGVPMRLEGKKTKVPYYYLNSEEMRLYYISSYEFSIVLSDSTVYSKTFRSPDCRGCSTSSFFRSNRFRRSLPRRQSS
jgi:hypothetical protein